jgi:hypothetical protein
MRTETTMTSAGGKSGQLAFDEVVAAIEDRALALFRRPTTHPEIDPNTVTSIIPHTVTMLNWSWTWTAKRCER